MSGWARFAMAMALGVVGCCQESLSWGQHRVVFKAPDQPDGSWICRIQNKRGHVLKELRAPRFILPSMESIPDAFLLDLDDSGQKTLHLVAWSGGAYGAYVDYLFDQDARGRVKNRLIYEGGEGRLFKFVGAPNGTEARRRAIQDLDGDGRPELILDHHNLQPLAAHTHGPVTALVLSWDGRRYVDATKRYPHVPRHHAQQCQQDATGDPEPSPMTLYDAALGWVANCMLAGDPIAPPPWLKTEGAAWLSSSVPQIRALLQRTPGKIRQDQTRVLRAF